MANVIAVNWKPSARVLRQFGAIACVGFVGLAFATWNGLVLPELEETARSPLAWVLSGLGLFSVVASLVAPKGNLPLYLALTLVSYPTGFVFSHIVMGVLFFLVITPISLVRRAANRDPLSRRIDPTAPTYWIEVKPGRTKDSYFRQF